MCRQMSGRPAAHMAADPRDRLQRRLSDAERPGAWAAVLLPPRRVPDAGFEQTVRAVVHTECPGTRDRALRKQIEMDRPRLVATEEMRTVVYDLLYVWAMAHPSIGYVQGMDHMALGLFEVLRVSAQERYAALCALLRQMQPFYGNEMRNMAHALRLIERIVEVEMPELTITAAELHPSMSGAIYSAMGSMVRDRVQLRRVWDFLLSYADRGFQYALLYAATAGALMLAPRCSGTERLLAMQGGVRLQSDVDLLLATAHQLHARHHDLLKRERALAYRPAVELQVSDLVPQQQQQQ